MLLFSLYCFIKISGAMLRFFSSSSANYKLHFLALFSFALGIGIPNVYKKSTIKCFCFLYTSSKNISIAGAMQRFFSSSKETKTHFLALFSFALGIERRVWTPFVLLHLCNTKEWVVIARPSKQKKERFLMENALFCSEGNAQLFIFQIQ